MSEKDNTFTLMNGIVLTGIPLESPQDPDHPECRRWPSREVQDAEEELFVQNAHYLLANAPRIMSDSRMFLAPVNIQSGMAYAGAFVKPCLGGYLEWWLNCPCSTHRDGDKVSLTYRISGSMLSGVSASRSVSNDGTTGGGTAGLRTLAASFAQTMRRYAEARRRFVADSLADVIATLRGLRGETQNPLTLTILRRKVEHLESDVKDLTAENLERKHRVRELELGLAQAVVRECRVELREALTEKDWNPRVQEIFKAFSKREGVKVFSPSRRVLEEELAKVGVGTTYTPWDERSNPLG